MSIGKIVLLFLTTIAGTFTGNRVLGQTAGPHVLVYKTKKDYSRKVPVLLSADKKSIVSYPHPQDIRKKNGQYPEPVKLKKGYLLDKRGIGPNVAFLKISYAQYAALQQAPPMDTLWSWIIDKDPLTVLYDCGSRYDFKDPVADLNRMISNGRLQKTGRRLK